MQYITGNKHNNSMYCFDFQWEIEEIRHAKNCLSQNNIGYRN